MAEALVREAEGTDRGRRISTADDREPFDLGERLGDGLRAGRERRELEDAHRAVPEDRGTRGDDFREAFRGLRADVESEARGAPLGVLDRLDGTNLVVGIRRERGGDHGIHREDEVDPESLCLGEVPAHGVELVLLEDARADTVAEGGEEGEHHPASDEKRIHAWEQVPDDPKLVRDLGAAEHDRIRLLRRPREPVEYLELRGDQSPGHTRKELGEFEDARLLAVNDAEAIGDEGVAELRESARELAAIVGRLRRLPRVETQILEEGDVTVPQPVDGGLRRVPNGVAREHDGAAEELTQPLRDRREAVLRIRDAIRPAEMRDNDDAGTRMDELVERRERGPDAPVVGDDLTVERHVEVAADDDALPRERAQ